MTAQLPMFQQITAAQTTPNDEYYTPPEYLDAVREVFGSGIDLDPASCAFANQTVKAARFFTKDDNGLAQPWKGRVYNNPPYSKIGGSSQAGFWFQKLLDEYRAGAVMEEIFLCNVATGAQWFRPLFQAALCFVSPRIAFLDAQGVPQKSPRYDNVFAYLGTRRDVFEAVFSRFGAVK